MVTQELPMQLNPAWLNSPPETTFPLPPTDTRVQTLPYNELSWENFERLILRIVRREATVAECLAYGKRGQKQYGLDILAELRNAPGEFACYQCKRVEKFAVSDIKRAVDEFLQGKWACKTKRFILCTSLQLTKTQQVDEISRQRDILATKGIEFETWDGSESGRLSERLKNYADLVDDFFLREWVRLFNGQEAADSLGQKLDGGNLSELRTQLLGIYTTLFHRYDQGIRLGSTRTTPLLDRYITPTIIEIRELSPTEGISTGNARNLTDQHYSVEGHQQTLNRSTRATTIQEIRMPIGDWLSRHNRSVILGEPGYGKSALLRVAALQLLNGLDEPFFIPWHGVLPVWISFGGFSAAVQRQNGLSVEDYFDQWLHQHGADSIRPLFRRAVKQGEILLLIDGLDEGQDLHGAQRAMDLLSTFLSIRPIPAIFTSRPRSYSQMQPDGAWSLARLASFDEAQIERFAYTWFKHLETQEVATEKGYAWAEASTEQRKVEFLKAVRANPRVMDLARTPLFCQLLIDVFRFSHHLPEQRIKVYDKVIELLLSDHPAARVQSAGLPSPPETPRTDDMREMLMRLALHIQINSGAGVISSSDCQTVFCDFLTDDINGPGYSPYEARHQAKSVIDYAQTGLGLVVERAPDELGFFHLAVQEYLAAQAMVRKEEQTQLDWLAGVWDQSRWHEVVLSWFSIMGSEHGKGITQRAIDHLKQIATGPLAELQLLRLRTELAAGDLGLSPREARTTIEESANQVETTPFPELRQALSRHITLGLRSPSVAKNCEERITNWVPARSEWGRARLLEVFGNWQMSEDLLHTLKLALHDESGRCRLAAAESLARVFASDATVGEHLAVLAAKWPDTGVRAAALHGLWKGWPQHEALNELADAACRSNDMKLALTGIALRVENHRHDTKDRQRMWFMLSHGSISFELRDFCREVLVKGWSKDKDIKSFALEAICNQWRSGRRFEEEEILTFLAQSWPEDSEVGCCIADWFARYSPSFLLHDDDKWRILFKNFRGHKDLSSALKRNLLDQKSRYNKDHWDPNTKWAYCVIGDDAAKMDVLEAYTSVEGDLNKRWVVSTLMEAWPDDSDVRALFIQEFHCSPAEVAFLSPWIDAFVSNPEKRRAWLLDALGHCKERTVSAPIHRLLEEFKDEECLKAVLAILEKDIWYYDKIGIQNQLIESFPHLPEVRQWAESSFLGIDGPSIASVATGFQQDPLIRERLLRSARPAKVDVRAEVFRIFRENSIPKDSGLRLTASIWAEEKGGVRSSGVVAHCIMASQNQDLVDPLITRLCEEIKSLGTHYEIRRRSAFAGLLELNEYDACVEAMAEEKTPSLHWLAGYHSTDVIAARMLFEHWNKLTEASRTQSQTFEIPWGAIIHSGVAREAFSNSIARAQLIDYLKAMRLQNRSPMSLALMADLLPNSSELRSCLIESIKGSYRNDTSFEAQRIFVKQFAGDEQALIELQKFWNKSDGHPRRHQEPPPFLYALILGWPDSPVLRPYLEQQKLPEGVPLITALALSGINGNEDQALACIDRLIQMSLENSWTLPDIYRQSLRDWIRTPHADRLLRRLIDDRQPSRKISATGFLATIGKLTNEDRMDLVRQFDEVLGDNPRSCIDGVDLVSGTVTTLPQAIFRFLMPEL